MPFAIHSRMRGLTWRINFTKRENLSSGELTTFVNAGMPLPLLHYAVRVCVCVCSPIATYAQIKLITDAPSSASVNCILPH